jgi:hypothetical protein
LIEGEAVVLWRKSRRQERAQQTQLARLLAEYLDPCHAFATVLENQPRSLVSGLLAKKARRSERAT